MAAQEKTNSAKIAKVLVFAPPRICFHQPLKKAKIENKAAHGGHWDKINFRFDGVNFVKTNQIDPRNLAFRNVNTDASEDSCIFLDYDPKFVQESVNSYLDQEFSEPSPVWMRESRRVQSSSNEDKSASLDQLQKEYETVNYESQVLLRSSALNEKESVLQKEGTSRKKKNVHINALLYYEDTHQLTEDDVYTQQRTPDVEAKSSAGCGDDDSKSSSSSTTSKDPSLTSVQSTSTTVPSLQSTSTESTDKAPQNQAKMPQIQAKAQIMYSLPMISNKLSNLADCTKVNDLVNLCVIILQVNPVKEIQIKSGRNAGQFVPLSSIIVSDVTKSHFKLTLWREASGWTEKIVAGDIIVATSIRIETWRDEHIGQTTFHSSFYNLHQPQKPLSSDWLRLCSQDRLDKLIAWTSKMYGYLFRKTPATVKVTKYTRISDLQNNTLVHFRGVLRSVCASTDKSLKNTYKFGSRRLPKITAIFAQSPEDEVCVTLWGRQSEWLDSLRKAQGTVWELQYLTAKHDSTSGTMVLHTSPKSTKKKLNNDHELAKPLLSLLSDIPVDIKTFRTIKELLEAKFTGNVEVNGRIHSMTFRSVENEALEVESCHDIEALEGWCHRLTYIGCATCSRALIQDKNKIYGQCTYCVFHKPGYNYALVRYFRNVTIRVKDADGVIEIIANHKSACKLFNGIEAKHFDQSTNNQISPKVREFIETVRGLFSCDKLCGFILSCHTIRDENSFVMCRTFNLLDCVQQASIKKHAQTEK